MIDSGSNLFAKFLYEAPGDDPPDISSDDTGSPDIDGGDDLGGDRPPDLGMEDESPPDLDGDDFGDDSFGGDDYSDAEEGSVDLGLDEKVSAILNAQLYKRFLALKSKVTSQISMLKHNSDVLNSISSDTVNNIDVLKKLDENIHLYLKNYFLNANYSKNLLFFNKCLNLLKILNDTFDQDIKKGLKHVQ